MNRPAVCMAALVQLVFNLVNHVGCMDYVMLVGSSMQCVHACFGYRLKKKTCQKKTGTWFLLQVHCMSEHGVHVALENKCKLGSVHYLAAVISNWTI